MRRDYILLFLATLLFLISLLGLISYLTPLQKFEVPTSVIITEKSVGFDVNSTALTFGKISLGGSSVRNFIFKNSYPFPVVLHFAVVGNIAPLISFSDVVYIESGVEKKIPFSVSASKAGLGNYTGTVYVSVKRA